MKNGKTILVDVDGVLAKYNGWKDVQHVGEPIPGALAFLDNLYQDYRVVIYTTRIKEKNDESYKVIENWLNIHGFKYDAILPGKPSFTAIIDDRAIGCRPQDNFYDYEYALNKVQQL